MSRKVLLIALLAVVPFFMVGCGKDDVPVFKNADYRLANTAIAEDLDLHRTDLASDFQILGNVMEGLMMLGENDAPILGVAEDYDISSDGMTYTFYLREDAKWSNGDPVTAQDFVYGWRRAIDPNTAAAYASMLEIIENGKEIRNGTKLPESLGIEAKNDSTVVVKLVKPVPWFLQLTAFPTLYPAHQETIEKYGDDFGSAANKVIYNGPYKVTYWDVDYGIYLEKNDKYWDAENVDLNSISFRKIEQKATLLTMYQTGEIDRVGLTGSEYEEYEDDATIVLDVVTWYLQFNIEDKAFSNENLRLAMAYGIDKAELTSVMKPYVPADSFVPPRFTTTPDGVDFRDFKTDNADSTKWNYNPDTNGMYNAATAQTYLNAAIAELQQSDDADAIFNDAGNIEVNMSVFDSEGWQPLFENIQFQLNELNGLEVVLDKAPATDVYDNYDTKEYEFGFAGWGPDYPNPLTFVEMWHSEDSHNYPGYDNATFDQLIDDARSAEYMADVDAQFELLAQAEDMFLSEAIIVPLAYRAGGVLDNGDVKGLILHNSGYDASWKYLEKN